MLHTHGTVNSDNDMNSTSGVHSTRAHMYTSSGHTHPAAAAGVVAAADDEPLDLVPPFRFAAVEEGVYRGAYPTLRNFAFLRRRRLRCIVCLTPEEPTYDLRCFAAANGTTLRHIHADRYKGEAQLLPSSVSAALTVLMDAAWHPVYVHCLDGSYVTGLVILALRKLQQWSLAAAAAEYRRFVRQAAGDAVTFVGEFVGPVTVPSQLPPWLWEGSWCDAAGNVKRGLTTIKLRFPRTRAAATTTTTSAHAPLATMPGTTTTATTTGAATQPRPRTPPGTLPPSTSADVLSSNLTSTNASLALTTTAAAAALSGNNNSNNTRCDGAGAAASESQTTLPQSCADEAASVVICTHAPHNHHSSGSTLAMSPQSSRALAQRGLDVPGAVAVSGEGVFIDVAQLLHSGNGGGVVSAATSNNNNNSEATTTTTEAAARTLSSSLVSVPQQQPLQHVLASYYQQRQLPSVLPTAQTSQQQQQQQQPTSLSVVDSHAHRRSHAASAGDKDNSSGSKSSEQLQQQQPMRNYSSDADVATAMLSVQPFSLRVSHDALAPQHAMAVTGPCTQHTPSTVATAPSAAAVHNMASTASSSASATTAGVTTATATTTATNISSATHAALLPHRRGKRRKSI